MIRKIIARNGESVLVRTKGYRITPGQIEKVINYEVWINEFKYREGLAAEMINGEFKAYCMKIKTENETDLIKWFLTKKNLF